MWSLDGTLTGTTDPSQSWPGSNGSSSEVSPLNGV